jgi:2-aminobenzoate-CoA ligase
VPGRPDATRQLWKVATGIDLVDSIGATEMFHIFISSAGAAIKPGAVGCRARNVAWWWTTTASKCRAHGRFARCKAPPGCRYLTMPGRPATPARMELPRRRLVAGRRLFFYQARDDMIITAGYNVAGPEWKRVVAPGRGRAVAVIGVPDERGMIVKAFVVLKPGTTPTPHDQNAAGPRQIDPGALQVPRQISYMAALPRTETGKLQRFKLRPP